MSDLPHTAGTRQLARADRILDSATTLLRRWGYRRVTVDELARHAGVGKGTIYLHWRSREDIFHAAGAREAAAMTGAVINAIRNDADEVQLHRYQRRLFIEAMNRPVLRALYTRDSDTLGKFLAAPAHRRLEETKLRVNRAYLTTLAAHGLLRAELRTADLEYTLPVLVFGFFAAEPFLPDEVTLTLEQKADQLATTVHRTFAPPGAPKRGVLKAAAAEAIPAFEELAGAYLSTTYGGQHDERDDA